ncbi:MAG: hypothetical protein WCT19_02895 [Candidatus Paceibacterota bacterium]|jgi:uncharacterized membrane protein HdeD (DUF308 family)
MITTLFLAKLMGAFSIIAGLSMMLRNKMVMSIFDEMSGNRALVYVLGVIELVGGLIIVLNHNIWTGKTFTLVISVLGWMLLLEGVLYVFVSQKTSHKIFKWLHRSDVYYVFALAYVVLGAYLAYYGFHLY